jgi:hypothetical protein
MVDFIHQDLADGRWFTMTLAEQLGNAGSEVGRAINWNRRGNLEQRNKAIDRALELLDLTIADSRWRNRLTEIIRARHLLADLFYGKNELHDTPANLEKYFYYFALEARKGL